MHFKVFLKISSALLQSWVVAILIFLNIYLKKKTIKWKNKEFPKDSLIIYQNTNLAVLGSASPNDAV